MVRGGSKACLGGLLTRFLVMGGRPGSSESESEISILSEILVSHFSAPKIAISNSVSEEPGRPPMARNRVRSLPGHAFEPPRAIPFISEQLLNFRKLSKFSSSTILYFRLHFDADSQLCQFFQKISELEKKLKKKLNLRKSSQVCARFFADRYS